MGTNLKRKLVIERPFLSRPDSYAILAAIVKGAIKPEQLKLALQHLKEKYPILNTHVEIDENHHAWLISNKNTDFPLQIMEIKENHDWISKVLEEYNTFYPLDTGPLIRFVLLKHQTNCILIISAHHLLVDGNSLAFLLHNIMQFLVNPSSTTNPELYPPLHELLPTTIKLSTTQKLLNKIAKILWRRRERKGMAFSLQDYNKIHSKFCPLLRKDLQIHAITLDEVQTSNLIDRCKQEKISVNSAICAAFVKADYEAQRKNTNALKEFLLPVDVREILSLPKNAIGLYVSTVDITLDHDESLDLWDFARFAHEEIQRNMNPQNILNLLGRVIDVPEQVPDAAFFAKYGIIKDWFLDLCLRATKLDKINYSYSISNLGKFDFPKKYDDLVLEKAYFHTYGEMAEKQLTIITIGDKLTICISFLSSVIERKIVEKIVELALNWLLS